MKDRKSEKVPVKQIVQGWICESETKPQRMVTIVYVAEKVRKQKPMEVVVRLRVERWSSRRGIM